MHSRTSKILLAALCLLLLAAPAAVSGQDVSSSPTSLSFGNEYVGLQSGSKALTISNLLGQSVFIASIGFDCPQFGLSSGVAPFTLTDGSPDPITHYSIFFQPNEAGTYKCNFLMNMWDGTVVKVPVSGTGVTTTASPAVSPSSLSFPSQKVGVSSAPQTITVTNSGPSSVSVTAITVSPADFTIGNVTVPYKIQPNGGTLQIPVYYTPSHVISVTGAIDITYNSIPDQGASLSGNGIAATATEISTPAALPSATQAAEYQYQLSATGSPGPFSWSVASGSALPSGLSLASSGLLSGTVASSVAVGNYPFSITVSDQSIHTSATTPFTLGVYANQGDNCNDLSYNDPDVGSPLVALTDLGTGMFEGYEGGLYPNGSNVRPPSQDSYGVGLAYGITPLDSSGNPDSNGVYALLALGESTAQNEFNRFLPMANADPAKNKSLVIVNGAQGGATPNDFANMKSNYWGMVLNNYLPQSGVTPQQVVAIWIEDTDGIASGTFPSDMTNLQSEYESMMNNIYTLFPNIKMVYFSSRVYGGYSNGVGSPDNPEPYAYEVSWAVKWAIQDQLDGNTNLNFNPLLGPVVAPWMSWGTYYWSNGMLGRQDGLTWECADFAADGTHPTSNNARLGQLKVAQQLLTWLKSDDTTVPWYLAPTLALAPTAGNDQSGSIGVPLPVALTVLASNTSNGAPIPGVTVTFSDGGAGGTFGSPSAVTGSNGQASSTYTPQALGTITITAASAGYNSAIFSESTTASAASIVLVSGGKQSGVVGTTLPKPIVVKAKTSSGAVAVGASITFANSVGGTFSPNPAITGSNGEASTTFTLPTVAKTFTSTASAGAASVNISEQATSGPPADLTILQGNDQSANPKAPLPKKLIVSVTDEYKNPLAGVTVNFTDNGAGGTFSPASAVTGSNGEASTAYITGSTAATITISASTSTLGPVNFTETVR